MDYLQENTDQDHPVNVQTLIEYLAEKGIQAERKSIYDDISHLREYGMDIAQHRGRNGGYYVSQREFELSELKLLVDAVLSSRFLTTKQSVALVKKLAALSSTHEAELLRREIVLAGRVKQDNDSCFVNIDILYEAIAKNRQITFRYYDWGIDLKKHFRTNNYTASPYALLWDDENYYLIANSQRHGLTHYRVDKMEDIQLSPDPRVYTKEASEFSPGAYSKEVFGMFRGQRQRVKLRFENSLAGVVVDRFGKDIMPIPDGKTHFTLTVNVLISPNFLGWVASFCGRAAIIFPQSAVEEYRKLCQAAIAALPSE